MKIEEKHKKKGEMKMKKQRGITLVSLVITIIVLIILAGISINTLVGQNGIITRAQQAKENMILAQKREEEQLNELYKQLEESNQGISPEEGTIEELTKQLQDLQSKFDNLQVEYDTFKENIASAITERGVEISESDPVYTIVESIKDLGVPTRLGSASKITASSYSFNVAAVDDNYANYTADNFLVVAEQRYDLVIIVTGTGSGTALRNATYKITKTYDPATGILTISNGGYQIRVVNEYEIQCVSGFGIYLVH